MPWWGRDLHDYGNCSEFSWASLDHFDCDCGFCVGLSALSLLEFASRIPSTGGAYSYLYAIFGEFPAWIAGWLTVMESYDSRIRGWLQVGLLISRVCWPILLEPADGFKRDFDPAKGTYVDLLPILVMVLVTALVLRMQKRSYAF